MINRPFEGIATDAAHSTKHGLTRYRGIDLKTGKQLFIRELGNQTVNIGEFLGVVEGVKFILENNYTPAVIYTDSLTAISWFKNKKTSSKKKNIQIKMAEIFLNAMSAEIDKVSVKHWDNKVWGEIPADFGNK